jgi:Hemerythrin HHE cation binding domain
MSIALHLRGRHALLEGVTLSGAFTGAVLGGVSAGAAGAVAGGLIGAGMGLVTGAGLERANSRAETRDSELDEEIGVRGGDLGAREIASAALTNWQLGAAGAGTILRRDHVHLDCVSNDLSKALRTADESGVRRAFHALDLGLETHLATEESGVFPRLEETEPNEVSVLRAQHAELRRLVDALRNGIVRGVVDRAWLGDILVQRLREHASREDTLLYPAANAWLPASAAMVERRTPDWGSPR